MSRWTHAVCIICWTEMHPNREPVQMKEPDPETCCFCGGPANNGIYIRHDPEKLQCKGVHPGDEE